MPQELTIDGRHYTLVRGQRSGVSVYRGDGEFMRLGPPEEIGRHIGMHAKLAQAGFPVPALISEGLWEDSAFFREISLGEAHFGELFAREYASANAISDRTFDAFIAVAESFLRAQLRTNGIGTRADVAHATHVDTLCDEFPQDSSRIQSRFETTMERLAPLPWVITHGDFNPHNMYPGGVIDFEDTFHAPFGYDAVTAIVQIDWFPDEGLPYEYGARYRYAAAQRKRYQDMTECVAREAGQTLVEYDADFEFLRAAWSTARMGSWPHLQAWRYRKFSQTFLA